ncbi:MAG TPA: S41 family peptidase, partial [Fibrella sp.]
SLQSKVLSPSELQADFRYLRRLLEETHPGLYRYVPKAAMQAKLDSLAGQLSKPLPFYDFYRLVAGLMADIRCAHTHALPAKEWEKAFANDWKTLPFFMFPVQNRSYVLFNGTTDQTIKPGYELLSINGRSMASIREVMYRYHWADGYIETSKQAALQGQLFALFYYWFIDRPDTYHLTFKSLSGDTLELDAAAQPFLPAYKRMTKNPVNKQMMTWYNAKKPKHPWRLYFPKDMAQTAYLRFDSFGGEGATNSEQAVARFRSFMDASMAKIEKKGTKNLVIDVRHNPGGWDSQGIELFTYLAKSDTAVKYYARQHSITDSTEFLQFSDLSEKDRKNVKQELARETDGTFTLKGDGKPFSPKANRFKGQVYIVMNGRSASTTSEFLAVAHANRIGTFIGEESGGAYEGGNGGSFVHLSLPHSNIQVTTPLLYYNNAVGKPREKGRGTMPDYTVPITLDNLLNHNDDVSAFVKELIKKQGLNAKPQRTQR